MVGPNFPKYMKKEQRELLRKIEQVGDIGLEILDEMNVPVNVEIDNDDDYEFGEYRLSFECYQPRKSRICNGSDCYGTKEDLEKIIDLFITPLYEAALTSLKTKHRLYFWQVED